jgi:hypothetical protein
MMKMRHLMAATAALMVLGMPGTAFAQDGDVAQGVNNDNNDNNDGNGSSNVTNNDNNAFLSNNDNNDTNSNNDNNDGNGNNRDNGNGNAVANDFLDLLSHNSIGNGNNRDNQDNDYTDGGGEVIADQTLVAIITNNGESAEVVEDTEGYESGDNTIRGSAFSAFAGILTQSWNTGVNANVQAATNIAARGDVNFGDGD